MAPNIVLAPNMTQNAERKHRTQNTNTAHFKSSNELLSKTGLKAIIQGYGTTEIGCFITVDDSTDFVPGSTGFLGPNTQIKVWDNL